MALFRRRRKENQQPQSARDIAGEAVEPFDVRFAAIPSATAAPCRSGGTSVFVEGAAESVVAAYAQALDLVRFGDRFGQRS